MLAKNTRQMTLAGAMILAMMASYAGGAMAQNSPEAKPEAKEESAIMKKAEKCYRTGKWKEAADLFREAIREEPNNAKAHQRLGAILAGMASDNNSKDTYDTAILECKQAIKLDPTYFLPQVVLGQIYANQGEMEKALECFKEAVRLKPSSFRAQMDYGLALTHLEKVDEAIAAYQAASRLDEKDMTPYLNLGVLYAQQENWPKAIESEHTALTLGQAAGSNPAGMTPAYINLGNIYAE